MDTASDCKPPKGGKKRFIKTSASASDDHGRPAEHTTPRGNVQGGSCTDESYPAPIWERAGDVVGYGSTLMSKLPHLHLQQGMCRVSHIRTSHIQPQLRAGDAWESCRSCRTCTSSSDAEAHSLTTPAAKREETRRKKKKGTEAEASGPPVGGWVPHRAQKQHAAYSASCKTANAAPTNKNTSEVQQYFEVYKVCPPAAHPCLCSINNPVCMVGSGRWDIDDESWGGGRVVVVVVVG